MTCLGQNSADVEPHKYGGWYCPDNLNGFPAVDINNWEDVPVINGRMPTQDETQTEASLIFIDIEKYPNAKPLDLKMPQLARFYNNHSRKEEIVIVIQAINVSNDSVVGFRYLNGGNGSARFNEVNFLSDNEIDQISSSRFVSFMVKINATQDVIWEILTKSDYIATLQPIFDLENKLPSGWNNESKVNFKYQNAGVVTSEFAANMYGNQYIQIDCELDNEHYLSLIHI